MYDKNSLIWNIQEDYIDWGGLSYISYIDKVQSTDVMHSR